MMSSLRRRLTIPAQPLLTRERLKLVSPAIIRAGDAPPLLSYSDSGFIDAFLSLARRHGPVANEELPPLLAWRDWSEPPQALLDASGRATYPATLIQRAAPLGLRDAAASSGADRRDNDGIPAPETTQDPPWLRKLYLPQHERFTLVSMDAICERVGTPFLDRQRVKQAGMIVRRLKPNQTEEHWEDWFPTADGEGYWEETFEADLHRTGIDGAAGLGLDPEEKGLQSHRLLLIPADPDPQRVTPCRLYGYLPVWSAERQRRPDPASASGNAARKAIRQQRLADLQGIWVQRGAQPQTVLSLLRLVLLPARDGKADAAGASDVDIKGLLNQAIQRLARAGLDGKRFAADVKQTCADGPTLWSASGDDSPAKLAEKWLKDQSKNTSAASGLDALLRERLHQAVENHLTQPATSGLSARQWSLLLAAALVRARGHLLALARAVELKLAVAEPGFNNGPEDQWLTTLPALAATGGRPARPGAAVHSLGGLLEWAALFRQPDGTVRVAGKSPFTDAALAQRIETVLSDLVALQAPLVPVARQLGAAGSSLRAALAKGGQAIESGLLQEAGIDQQTTNLASLGLPLDESPAEGLLVAPGLHPSLTDLQSLITSSQSLDAPKARFGALLERSEAVSTELRYDSQHLYAVWCWVRVGGRTPCEREQLIWSQRSEPFRIAEPHDLLGARPVSLPMPDLPRMLKDMGRIIQARAKPFAAVRTPPQSGFAATDLGNISRRMGLGGSCSFGIPVFTICALVMFSIVFSILSLVLRWLPFLQICTPTVDESP